MREPTLRCDSAGLTYMPAIVTSCCENRWERARPYLAYHPVKEEMVPKCRICGSWTKPRLMKLEGWHFRETDNHLQSKALVHGSRVEVQGERVIMELPPAIAAWYDYAHSDRYKDSYFYPMLRARVKNNIFVSASEDKDLFTSVEKSLKSLNRKKGERNELSKESCGLIIEVIIREVADMKRINSGAEPRVNHRRLARILGVDHKTLLPRAKPVVVKNERGRTQSNCTPSSYHSPLCRLIRKIENIIQDYEAEIY